MTWGCQWLVGRVCCWAYSFIKNKLLSSGRPHIEGLQPYTRMLPVLGGYIFFLIPFRSGYLKKIQNQGITGFGFLKKTSKSKNRFFRLFTKSQRTSGLFFWVVFSKKLRTMDIHQNWVCDFLITVVIYQNQVFDLIFLKITGIKTKIHPDIPWGFGAVSKHLANN